MKFQNRCLFVLTIAVAAGCSNLPRSRDLANPDVAGATLAQQVCSNCHGVAGAATSPNFPNLAAQQKEYLAAQLTQFRSHSRRDPAGYEYMWGISRVLTDRQISELADYYAAQQPTHRTRENAAAKVDAGRALFTTGVTAKSVPSCASCHGQNGEGSGKIPRIAGQHQNYLIKQLTAFQRTDERPAGVVMKAVAHDLSHDEIIAVTAYAQSLATD
jgi:cbb3-type cytochrome c oxidase subunit III